MNGHSVNPHVQTPADILRRTSNGDYSPSSCRSFQGTLYDSISSYHSYLLPFLLESNTRIPDNPAHSLVASQDVMTAMDEIFPALFQIVWNHLYGALHIAFGENSSYYSAHSYSPSLKSCYQLHYPSLCNCTLTHERRRPAPLLSHHPSRSH